MIDGPGAGVVTVSGGGAVQVFEVDSGVTATLSGLTISGGSSDLDGGGLANYGTTTLDGCTISGNVSGGAGGGLLNDGTAALTNCTVSSNSAGSGGAIYNRGTMVVGDSALTSNSATSNFASDGGGILNDGQLDVSSTTFADNRASGGGGAIYTSETATLTMDQGFFTSNSAEFGGAVLNYSATATFSEVTFAGNSVSGTGGAIENVAVSFPSPLTLTNCTLSGNSAAFSGGAIWNSDGPLTLTNCTISGNSAGSDGGGVVNTGSGTAILTSSTISGNSAEGGGGGLYNNSFETATLIDSIVAGNTLGAGPSDIGGNESSLVTGSFNLIGTGGSGGIGGGSDGNIVLTSLADLGLAPLGDYGGPTATMALLPGSPAIGAGTAESGITTDQRGEPLDSPPDIGAFQTQTSLVVNTTIDGTGSPPGDLSLRQAVNLANALGGAETITFDPTVFATAQTITLTAGPLELSNTTGTETIIGPAAGVTINAGGQSRVFQIDSGVTANISGLSITGGSTTGSGGGLYNYGGTATLTGVTVSGNTAASGGGLFTSKRGTITVVGCTISGNTAAMGAGLYDDGTTELTDCTISGNSATAGGGLFITKRGTITVIGCTISGNTAAAGGGIYDSATSNPDAGTIGGNSAATGSGIDALASGSATVENTIIAANTGTGGSPSDIGGDNSGSVVGTYDLVGPGGAGGISGTGDIVLTNLSSPLLAPLGNYGGPTQTMPLLPGSAGVGAGIAIAGVMTDQRGFAVGATPDIGAFQIQPSLVVNTTSDGATTPPGGLSLRQAVNLANALYGAETITFDPTVFAMAQTIALTQGQLELSNTSGTETIMGPAAGVTVTGGGMSRVFQVDAMVNASISGLTITSGSTTGYGGGLSNYGTLTLSDCTVSGNSAADSGGGISSDGPMTLSNCTISDNTAEHSCGGINLGFSTTTLSHCTVSGNSTPGFGGGIGTYKATTLTLTDCTVSGNSAQEGGGGINNYETTLTLTDCNLSGNSTGGGGGGLGGDFATTLTDCTFSGNSAAGAGGGLGSFGASAMVTDCTFSDNRAEYGGGLWNNGPSTTITGCTISGNSASQSGAGVWNSGTATLTGCTVDANTAAVNGGGLASYSTLTLSTTTVSDNTAGGYGGGIIIGGTTTLTNCAVSGNSASGGGGGIISSGPTALTNCTVSGNTAGGVGGGINSFETTLTLTDCTVSGNTSTSAFGGVYLSGTATLNNTIVAGNTDSSGASDIGGPGTDLGSSNLIGTGGSGGLVNEVDGNLVGVANAGLAPLGNYGGPTETMALLPTSAAIGAGTAASGITTDQRGAPRPTSGAVDIGAFQDQGYTVGVSSGSRQGTLVGQAFDAPLVAVLTENFAGAPVPGVTIIFSAPSSGPSATLSAGSAVTDASGQASLMATANASAGSYVVLALSSGADNSAPFGLTNQLQPGFSGLTGEAVTYGTAVVLTGKLAAGAAIPAGEEVAVTLDGVTHDATIAANGSFSTEFTSADVKLNASGTAYTATFDYTTDGFFTAASGSSQVTVNPAALTISASSDAKVYDGLTASTTAPGNVTLAGGDTITGITEAFTSKNVLGPNGSTLTITGYTINDGNGGKNYVVTTRTAPGTITPAALTITATGDTKAYDGTTSSSKAPNAGSLYSGDTISGLTQAFASPNVMGANGSTLTVTGYAISDGDGGKDYTVTTVPAPGTITPIPLSVAVKNASIVYGSSLPAFNYTIAGFIGDDNSSVVTGAPTITINAPSHAGVGSYPITIAIGTLSAANYTFPAAGFSGATLTVTPAPLVVTAVSTTMSPGNPLPAFTAVYTGFVNDDTPAKLTSPPVFRTTATPSSVPGTYLITVSGASSPNYTFTYVPGTLTVILAPATVESVSVEKVKLSKRKTVQEIVVQFSEALDSATAQSISSYTVTTAPTNKKQKSKPVPLSSASYSASAFTVTLLTRKTLVLNPPLELTVLAAGLLDAFGRELDGNDSGESGANFTAILSKSGTSVTSAGRSRESATLWCARSMRCSTRATRGPLDDVEKHRRDRQAGLRPRRQLPITFPRNGRTMPHDQLPGQARRPSQPRTLSDGTCRRRSPPHRQCPRSTNLRADTEAT